MGGKVIDTLSGFFDKLSAYFNPIGQFYVQIIFLARVLVTEVFLDDLFELEEDSHNELECETDNAGCELSCINRFSPINHLQLWQFELFCGMMCTCFFMAVNLLNQHIYDKKQKAKKLHLSSINFNKKRGKIHSHYTAVGYIFMLIFRLASEVYCIFIEYNLAKHHSQNSDNQEVFRLKETWLCPTYPRSQRHNSKAIDEILPIANRSLLFYRTDTVHACEQQQTTVTCWISYSRMKTLGIMFMFGVLCFQTCITALELLVELIKPLVGEKKGFGPKRGVEQIPPSNKYDSADFLIPKTQVNGMFVQAPSISYEPSTSMSCL